MQSRVWDNGTHTDRRINVGGWKLGPAVYRLTTKKKIYQDYVSVGKLQKERIYALNLVVILI